MTYITSTFRNESISGCLSEPTAKEQDYSSGDRNILQICSCYLKKLLKELLDKNKWTEKPKIRLVHTGMKVFIGCQETFHYVCPQISVDHLDLSFLVGWDGFCEMSRSWYVYNTSTSP